MLGHSDADVLLHAVTDSLLGAAALGDIGTHFPPNKEEYRGISSIILLEKAFSMLKNRGYSVVNIDSTIVCQRPRLAPHLQEMASNIAAAVDCEVTSINLKATTDEGVGPSGRGEAICAHSVALIKAEV